MMLVPFLCMTIILSVIAPVSSFSNLLPGQDTNRMQKFCRPLVGRQAIIPVQTAPSARLYSRKTPVRLNENHHSDTTSINIGGVDGWIEKSAQKARQLERSQSLTVDFLSSDYAVLKKQNGETVSPASLRNSSVALYFAVASSEECKEFTDALKSFYDAHHQLQESKLSIVFISSDPTEQIAKDHFSSMHAEWLMLEYGGDLPKELKRRYGVWAGSEAALFSTSISALRERRGGVPGVCVVDMDGEMVSYLDAESRGIECLLSWRPEYHVWPPTEIHSSP